MNAKKLVLDFYKSDALINPEVLKEFLHPEIIVEWNSSTGFLKLNHQELIAMAEKMNDAYIRSIVRIKNIIREGNVVSLNYAHFAKTIENPREEMFLAHFFATWEIKDEKLFKCYQMSQIL